MSRCSKCGQTWVMSGVQCGCGSEPPLAPVSGSAFVRIFKPRFADLVESGAKVQTCRPTPKRMPKRGDSISLREWTGKPYRSKQRIIREATVTRTRRVEIWPQSAIIALDGQKLGYDEMLNFARADGFADHWDMIGWFSKEHGLDKFEGIVIYWQNAPDQRRAEPK